MNDEYTIFVVDDVEAGRRMVAAVLAEGNAIETFPSAADCLARLASKVPDLFLLDVDMPEMDGYTLCRQLKADSATSRVPVIFISALADLDSCLAGYDAGGDDFIVKPFKAAQLKQKVAVLRRTAEGKVALEEQLAASDTLANLVLSNLDEYAVLIRFLRTLNGLENYRQVADEMLTMLRAFGLDGAVQFHLPDFELTLSAAGESRPVEVSIFQLLRSMETLVAYKNRLAVNFSRASLLVNNMPLDDAEKCGRLRDHLAIAVETADAKLAAMRNRAENLATKEDIAALLRTVSRTVHQFSEKYETARYASSETVRLLLAELDMLLDSLCLSENLENSIRQVIRTRTDQLIDAFDFSTDTEKTLLNVSQRLAQVLDPTAGAPTVNAH
ncbi:MAG: response regulator [Candidatus Accumulibacter sp.]|nr:response regulator [Accumulibacter sp.]